MTDDYDLGHRTFLERLRSANIKRAPDFHAGGLMDWSVAERGNELAGETGELCNVLKKMLRIQKRAVSGEGNPFAKADEGYLVELRAMARTELADVIICADLIGAQLGIDIEKATEDKFNATSDKIGSAVRL